MAAITVISAFSCVCQVFNGVPQPSRQANMDDEQFNFILSFVSVLQIVFVLKTSKLCVALTLIEFPYRTAVRDDAYAVITANVASTTIITITIELSLTSTSSFVWCCCCCGANFSHIISINIIH